MFKVNLENGRGESLHWIQTQGFFEQMFCCCFFCLCIIQILMYILIIPNVLKDMHNDNLRYRDFGKSGFEGCFYKNLCWDSEQFHIQYRLNVLHSFPLQRQSFEVYCLVSGCLLAFVPTFSESSVSKMENVDVLSKSFFLLKKSP